MYENLANSTVDRVDFGTEVERNWGRNWAEKNENTAEFFFKDPPCLDINIHLDILI